MRFSEEVTELATKSTLPDEQRLQVLIHLTAQFMKAVEDSSPECPRCNGTGSYQDKECGVCNGNGVIL